MPSQKSRESVLNLTISLSEVEALRSKAKQLECENTELKSKCALLEKQVHDLTDPQKQADAAAFKRSRRR